MQEDGTKSIQRKTWKWEKKEQANGIKMEMVLQMVLADNVAETDKVKVLRDMNIQCDNFIEARNLDKIVVNKSWHCYARW